MEEQQEVLDIDNLENLEYTAPVELDTTLETFTTTEHVEDVAHNGPFYQQPEFFISLSFFLVVFGLAKPIAKAGKAMLLKRIESIKSRINDANQLKIDANKLYKEYEEKFKNVEEEANNILTKNQKEIDFIKKETLDELEKSISTKERDAEARINSSKEKAMKEIVDSSSALALKAVKLSIIKKLDTKEQDKLIDKSINLIGQL